MGTVAYFEQICRLCGLESNDLINLFENAYSERNLTTILKKYIRVTVNPRDALPHQVCGPCVAKLDEVVEFMDISQATQNKLKTQLKESSSGNSLQIPEEHLYELIQDVKVELEETDSQFIDNVNDEDFGARTSKGRTSRTKSVRGRMVTTKGLAGKWLAKSKSKPSLRVPDIITVTDGNGGDNQEKASGENLKKEGMGNTIRSAVRCCVCKATFNHLEDLASHSLDVHQLPEPHYMCPQCPRTFPKITSMNNHQRRKHQDSLQECPKCKKLYPAHYLWTRHMLVHTNSRPFSCDECEKKFKSKAELFIHKKTHRPSEERYTHCCEVCGKRFTQKANLESHLRLHTGHRPFSCEFCGKCFSQRGNMEEHRRIHTGEKPFICDMCGISYSRQGQLAMHRRKHSGEKPHKCQFCGKEFLRREVLKKHEHVHTDTRPYKCSFCEKSFRDQGKKKVHERLHTGERPFECQFCGRGFCESGNLRKHLRVHQRHPGAALSSVPSLVRERESLLPLVTGSTVVSNGGPSYSVTNIPHSTFAFSGISTSRQSTDMHAETSLMVAPEVTSVATSENHSTSHSLPLGTHTSTAVNDSPGIDNRPLVTLRPLQESHASPGLSQTDSWAIYHT
ncbi:zinc finger protein interacting with ribonucleoprotein K isoform X2 [Procambarus clarkii]|uniref:zinc finger protein interacting with ribonucleoprotein K isoform X2 n=1 Tax=Procambarus clarkii TaxID=6728 RepID=UPI001E676DBF|nr:zinc finger protein 468-like isoform X2 [Procambarus clarkii]